MTWGHILINTLYIDGSEGQIYPSDMVSYTYDRKIQSDYTRYKIQDTLFTKSGPLEGMILPVYVIRYSALKGTCGYFFLIVSPMFVTTVLIRTNIYNK